MMSNATRHRSKPAWLAKVGIVAAAGIVAAVFQRSATPDTTYADSTGLVDGEAVVRDNGCLRCHSWDGVAVLEEGPSLDFAGDKLRVGWIDSFLRDPSASRMPVIPMTDNERSELLVLLRNLKRDEGFPRTRQGDAVRGEVLYRENRCAQCHNPERTDPDLTTAPLKLRHDWLVAYLLDPQDAQPHARMPTFSFSPDDASDIAAYLMTGSRDYSPQDVPDVSSDDINTFLRLGCVSCHRVGKLQGAPMAEHLSTDATLGAHRTGTDRIPMIFVSAEEENELWRTLSEWMETTATGTDTAASAGFNDYWTLPVPRQGEAPGSWSGLERSLSPSACGVCHPRQYYDWRTTLHARAYSPGFQAELRATGDPGCIPCHAPLAEQTDDYVLRQAAITCSGCHVRSHRRHGPPLREPDPVVASRTSRHGSVLRDGFFEAAEFCVRCHQFSDDEPTMNGKLIMNTYNEWRESPAAREGKACQSCHMPDRRHLWRGIHDPQMVRSNLDVSVTGRTVAITSSAGHRTPTYLIPRIVVTAWLEDADGQEITWSHTSWIIQRQVQLEGTPADQEFADTRLVPGVPSLFEYDYEDESAATLVISVDVEPDAYYRDLYQSRLQWTDPDPETRRLYEEALAKPMAPAYNVVTRRVPLP